MAQKYGSGNVIILELPTSYYLDDCLWGPNDSEQELGFLRASSSWLFAQNVQGKWCKAGV